MLFRIFRKDRKARSARPTDEMVTIIEARPTALAARLLALWQFRAFYPFLFAEITMKKFRGTFLGFWWLILRPLIPTVITVATFTFVARIESPGLPYAIFFLSGFVTWNMFQATVVFMPRTLLWMQGMMRRTYFPKLLVPLASVGPPLLELAVTLTIFALAVAYYSIVKGGAGIVFGYELLLFPVAILLALIYGVAIGTVTSVIALFFRDIVFSTSYFIQMFMFLTPVIYPVHFIPEHSRWILYVLNPMAQTIELARWSLTLTGDFHPGFLALAAGTIVLSFIAAVAFFLRAETFLADEL